jgi:hypothetical protein
MLLESFSAPYSLKRNTLPDVEFEKCVYCHDCSDVNTMHFDKDGVDYICPVCFHLFLDDVRPYLLIQDYEALELKLNKLKQL